MSIEETIQEIKSIRVDQDKINQRIAALPHYEAPGEITLARRAGQTVRHWLGETLGLIREGNPELVAHPYPHSDNPESTAISPTADTAK